MLSFREIFLKISILSYWKYVEIENKIFDHFHTGIFEVRRNSKRASSDPKVDA